MDYRETPAFRRGVEKAIEMGRQRTPPGAAKLPEGRRGLASSILASPRMLEWPTEVRSWLAARCDPWIPRSTFGLD